MWRHVLFLQELFEIPNETEFRGLHLHFWRRWEPLVLQEVVSASIVAIVDVEIFPGELDLVSSETLGCLVGVERSVGGAEGPLGRNHGYYNLF